MIHLIEKFFIDFYYFRVSSISLWQAVFLVSCGCALWNAAKLARRLSARDIAGLAAVFLLGAGLRFAASPRNIVETNYRGLASWQMVRAPHEFRKEYTIDRIRTSHQYYVGYGHAEYLKLFVLGSARPDLGSLWRISGVTATMNVLLMFFAAWLLFGDPKIAFWGAAVLAFSPADIRLAFGDSRYALGETLILLGLINFLVFFRSGAWTALVPALGFTYCLLYTHVIFLLFPLAIPFFFPRRSRRRPGGGAAFTRAHALLAVAALVFASPAYVISPIPYARLMEAERMWGQLSSYPWRVVRLLFGGNNSFLNPDFTPLLFMGLCLVGCAALWARARGVLAGLGAAVVFLTIPLVPDYATNSSLVRQQPVSCFYLLAAAFGMHAVVELIGRRLPRGLAAAAALLLLAAQPLSYAEFIGREYNYQKEVSFIREGCARFGPDFGGHVFTPTPARLRIEDACPGGYEAHEIDRSVSGPDRSAAFRPLDSLLGRGLRPVFYLSYACYYRHPMDHSPRAASGLHEDCARFMERYRLEPLLEKTFPSSVYDRESDNTEAKDITLGFYRIHPGSPDRRPRKKL